jgi:hypothetical protein
LNPNEPQEETPDLILDYKIAAEGVQLIEGQKVIRNSELWAVLE